MERRLGAVKWFGIQLLQEDSHLNNNDEITLYFKQVWKWRAQDDFQVVPNDDDQTFIPLNKF